MDKLLRYLGQEDRATGIRGMFHGSISGMWTSD